MIRVRSPRTVQVLAMGGGGARSRLSEVLLTFVCSWCQWSGRHWRQTWGSQCTDPEPGSLTSASDSPLWQHPLWQTGLKWTHKHSHHQHYKGVTQLDRDFLWLYAQERRLKTHKKKSAIININFSFSTFCASPHSQDMSIFCFPLLPIFWQHFNDLIWKTSDHSIFISLFFFTTCMLNKL